MVGDDRTSLFPSKGGEEEEEGMNLFPSKVLCNAEVEVEVACHDDKVHKVLSFQSKEEEEEEEACGSDGGGGNDRA